MAFLLNYNFQIQSKNLNTHGVFNPGQQNNQQNNQHRSPPRKHVLSHFDDSFPLESHTITRTSSLKDEDDFKYGHRPNFDQDDQLIFVIDDL
ncbi:hypothetical protein RB653_002344 [Dictyostelium firmibasis]|uniref:Uncharacterized protein n=1 Tax=Dictyostelium firmibasis TaxID=79012 RepID=A0AAN7TXM0_9MYCE